MWVLHQSFTPSHGCLVILSSLCHVDELGSDDRALGGIVQDLEEVGLADGGLGALILDCLFGARAQLLSALQKDIDLTSAYKRVAAKEGLKGVKLQELVSDLSLSIGDCQTIR